MEEMSCRRKRKTDKRVQRKKRMMLREDEGEEQEQEETYETGKETMKKNKSIKDCHLEAKRMQLNKDGQEEKMKNKTKKEK